MPIPGHVAIGLRVRAVNDPNDDATGDFDQADNKRRQHHGGEGFASAHREIRNDAQGRGQSDDRQEGSGQAGRSAKGRADQTEDRGGRERGD